MAIRNFLLAQDIASKVLEAPNGKMALEILNSQTVDILILDMKMPDMNGYDTATAALKLYPKLKILVTTMYDHESLVLNFIKLGVGGYMLKSDENLPEAISMVMKGNFYYSKQLTQIIKTAQLLPESFKAISLSVQEKRLLELIADGMNSEEIAIEMALAKNTVESYRKALIKKVCVNNSSELVAYAHKTGLI